MKVKRGTANKGIPRLRVGLLLVLGLGLLALVTIGVRALGPGSATPVVAASGGRAEVRVVVDPWARVYVNDQLFDVTPFADPVLLTPGTHQFRFEHPNAPAEKRQVSIVAGESILLDVTMTIAARAGTPSTQPEATPSAREPGP